MGDTTVRLDDKRYERLDLADVPCGTRPGTVLERVAAALGWETVPEVSDDVRAEMRAKIAQAEEDARRIYGDKPATE